MKNFFFLTTAVCSFLFFISCSDMGATDQELEGIYSVTMYQATENCDTSPVDVSPFPYDQFMIRIDNFFGFNVVDYYPCKIESEGGCAASSVFTSVIGGSFDNMTGSYSYIDNVCSLSRLVGSLSGKTNITISYTVSSAHLQMPEEDCTVDKFDQYKSQLICREKVRIGGSLTTKNVPR